MLGGEFTKKKGKPGPLAKAPPVSDCSFPSRLRAISLASKNGERGKSRAIPKDRANKFAALLKSHREPIGTPSRMGFFSLAGSNFWSTALLLWPDRILAGVKKSA